MKTSHRVIIGDARCMKELADGSVDLVVTSPPYWQLKDYGSRNEIGFLHSYEEYINQLNLVWQEAYRVLDNGCRLCINIGDQYARSVFYGRYKVIPIRTEIIKFCETIGFDYMGAVIWQKVATTHTSGGATIMGSYPYPRSGILKLDYEFILLFKKPGKSAKKIDQKLKKQSRITKEEWNHYFSGHWRIAGKKQQGHLAMFPLELPRRLIKMFSFMGDTVLDPFLGSGTTSLAALELQRNSVGYEINREFLPLIKEKLATAERRLFDQPHFEFVEQEPAAFDFDRQVAKLPYIFKDPLKLDKKVDPKKMPFDSRIDKNSSRTEEYHSVKEVLSPTLMILDSGQKIRLLGIKTDENRHEEAVRYLENKLKGQKVFLRFDEERHDAENHLLCYLYLRNKTFINAHLLKERLALVDETYDFKHKTRFLKYRG